MTEFEMLLACYRSGQVSERQWQEHLRDREFREWVEARAALSHPTPDGCGREGKHQWGGSRELHIACVAVVTQRRMS